jgi:hypothetical protein
VLRRLFLSLLLVWSLGVAACGSASAADQREIPDSPDVAQGSEVPVVPPVGQAAHPAQAAALDTLRRRAQAKLDAAREGLARAERGRAMTANRQLRFLESANLRRARAKRLRERAARAQKQADAAERQMVRERRSALQEVQAQRAAHSTELLNWLGSRATMFTVSLWLLLMAFFAAGWQPMLGWLAFRRAIGLDRATYAKALAGLAVVLAGGAAAVSALSPALSGVLSPLAIPVIAAVVIAMGLIAWRSTTLRVGTTGVPMALTDRRVVPGVAVVLTLVAGLGIGLIGVLAGEPDKEPVPRRTAVLARLAQPDPTAHPTTRVARLHAKAERADRRARQAAAPIATAASILGNAAVP